MRRWNETETNIFIKLYLSHRCLWDPDDSCYQSRFRRREAYLSIIPQFYALTKIQLDEDLVRAKLKSLRATYLQVLSKMKKQPGYVPVLSWFNEWHATFSELHTSKYHNNQELQDTLNGEETKESISMEDDSDEEQSSDADTEQEREPHMVTLKQEPVEVNIPIPITLPHIKKEPRKSNLRFPITDPPPPPRNKQAPISNEDEFDVYAKFIASQMRQLDKEAALALQMKIYSQIHEARMQALKND